MQYRPPCPFFRSQRLDRTYLMILKSLCSTSTSMMYIGTIMTLLAAVTDITACPAYYATPHGPPSPNAAQLAHSEATAGGSLPDGPLPTSLKQPGITILQLIALNELFEVAYFTDLLDNVSKGIHGYDAGAIAPLDKGYLVQSLTAILEVIPVSRLLIFLLAHHVS